MIKVYIAAPWKYKETAKKYAEVLKVKGFEVVSRWLDFTPDPNIEYEYPEKIMSEEAMNDEEDVRKANVMLYLNLEKSEGKATELGMALILDTPIFVIGGKQNNVFLNLPDYYHLYHINGVEDFIIKARNMFKEELFNVEV